MRSSVSQNNDMPIRRRSSGGESRFSPEPHDQLPPSRQNEGSASARGYTGHIFEIDFIGEVPTRTQGYREALHRLAKSEDIERARSQGHDIPYVRPPVALTELVYPFQPYPPTNPTKPFARDLRLEVAEQLGLPIEAWDHVHFYTAVGTPIDRYLGVDAFIEVHDPTTKTFRRITFDLSLGKREAPKADILVHELPTPDREQDAYLADIDWYAQRVASLLANAPTCTERNPWPKP